MPWLDRKSSNAYARRYTETLRQRAITAAGGSCKHCGFADWRALQFDHVHGKGNEKRRSGKERPGAGRTQKELLATLERVLCGELQILCANCNWIKRYERKEVGKGNTNARAA